MSEKLSKDQQLIAGIEFMALGRKYIIQEKKKKQTELLYFLDELHNFNPSDPDIDNKEDDSPIRESTKGTKKENKQVASYSEKLRKKYDPYLKNVEKKFGIEIDFQSKFVAYGQNKIDKFHQLCKYYLSSFCEVFNDDSLSLLIDSRPEKEQEDILYLLVLLKYSLQLQLPIEFKFRKIMHQTISSRRVVPYSVTTRNGYISLIGQDLGDKKVKSFILSCVITIQTDLENVFKKYGYNTGIKKTSFDLRKYEESDPNARFQRNKLKYQLKLLDKTYGHFKESFNIKHKILSKSKTETIVEFDSYDPYLVFQIVFNYGEYCILLSPKEEVGRFKDKLKKLSELYK